MFRITYAIISRLSLPVFFFYLLYRGIKEPAYLLRKRERFGFVPSVFHTGNIWFHAVSAGEASAAIPIIEHVLQEHPSERVLVTTTTPTGYETMHNRFGAQIELCYVPYDVPSCMKRFLKKLRPKMLFLLETELWPNLVNQTASSGTPIYLLNARLSAQSARGYERLKGLNKSMLNNIRAVACQYQDTADRFHRLGVPEHKLVVTGNVKFDLRPPANNLSNDHLHALSKLQRNGLLVWIGGSTHAREESILLSAHRKILQKNSTAKLIVVPRHVARTEDILADCNELGLRACALSNLDLSVDVTIVDQMGTLFPLYQLASVAFVGGSLQHTGGHNPIEPAFHGVPVLMGPNRRNFAEVCARFVAQECLFTVNNSDDIAAKVLYFHNNPDTHEACSQRARAVVHANQGALNRVCGLVSDWVEEATTVSR